MVGVEIGVVVAVGIGVEIGVVVGVVVEVDVDVRVAVGVEIDVVVVVVVVVGVNMTISLGIDTGLATMGWAIASSVHGPLVAGVAITKPLADRKTIDRPRRAHEQAARLAGAIAEYHPDRVVIEAMSFPRGSNALVPIALSWGVALGVVASAVPRPSLLTISPQRWQRLIVPSSGKTVDYDAVVREVERYGADRLACIKDRDRSHAIDAMALAVVGLLAPQECDVIWR